jgi:thioredoxin-dependent peroxiredoxin
LRAAGVEVVGVSADNEDRSRRFAEELALTYPLVADPEGEVLRAYGVRWPLIGWAQRSTFVIGRDRKVRLAFHSERDVDAHLTRSAAEAMRAAPS